MNGTSSPDLEVFKQMKAFDTSKPVILKAHRYLTDGQVKVVSMSHNGTVVKVTGTEEYTVQKINHSTWICDCPSRQPVCAHVVATSLICDVETFEAPHGEKQTPFKPGAFGSFSRIA